MKGGEGIRLLLTGGETGGHLYPALAVADALAEAVPGSESVFVGAAGRIDVEKNIDTKYTSHLVCMSAFVRGSLLANVTLPWKLLYSFLQALHLLRQYRSHVVMGVGAFPSVPVILAARIRKIPTLILEPNALPGLANKLIGKMVQRICVSQAGMEAFFPRDKIVTTGTPVRSALVREASNRQHACALLGIPEDVQTVLITGGSLGSVVINNMVLENLNLLAGAIGHVLWQTGTRDFQRIFNSLGDRLPGNCTIVPYFDRMGCAYAAADLVISSAGASSLSELALLGKPALIIPDPDVTENHQEKNARNLYKKDAFVLADANKLSSQTAVDIIELLNNRAMLEKLKKNILPLAQPQAARLIVEQILQLAGQR